MILLYLCKPGSDKEVGSRAEFGLGRYRKELNLGLISAQVGTIRALINILCSLPRSPIIELSLAISERKTTIIRTKRKRC